MVSFTTSPDIASILLFWPPTAVLHIKEADIISASIGNADVSKSHVTGILLFGTVAYVDELYEV